MSPTPNCEPGLTAAAIARTRVDCLRQLAKTAPASGVSVIGGAWLIAFWLYDIAPAPTLGIWLSALTAFGLLRFFFALQVKRKFTGAGVRRWEQWYALLVGATGLAWGLTAWIPLPDPDNSKLFVIVVVLFCILLVSGSTLVASSMALGSFSLALAVPLIARTLTLETKLATLFGLGLVMMAWLMLSAVRSHRSTLISAMHGRNEITELLQQQKVIFESAGEGIVFLLPKPA